MQFQYYYNAHALRATSSTGSMSVRIDGSDAPARGSMDLMVALMHRATLMDPSVDLPTAGGKNTALWPSNWTTGASKSSTSANCKYRITMPKIEHYDYIKLIYCLLVHIITPPIVQWAAANQFGGYRSRRPPWSSSSERASWFARRREREETTIPLLRCSLDKRW